MFLLGQRLAFVRPACNLHYKNGQLGSICLFQLQTAAARLTMYTTGLIVGLCPDRCLGEKNSVGLKTKAVDHASMLRYLRVNIGQPERVNELSQST